jgi:hypothetical protein
MIPLFCPDQVRLTYSQQPRAVLAWTIKAAGRGLPSGGFAGWFPERIASTIVGTETGGGKSRLVSVGSRTSSAARVLRETTSPAISCWGRPLVKNLGPVQIHALFEVVTIRIGLLNWRCAIIGGELLGSREGPFQRIGGQGVKPDFLRKPQPIARVCGTASSTRGAGRCEG